MATRSENLTKLQEYVKWSKQIQQDTFSTYGNAASEPGLDRTIQELTSQVEGERAALEKLKKINQESIQDGTSANPQTRLQQLHTGRIAYERLTAEAPQLPPKDSALPALLALRCTCSTISETKDRITTTLQESIKARQHLSSERSDLNTARLITDAIEKRIGRLRNEVDEKSQKTPNETARTTVAEQKVRKAFYEKETKKLVRSLVLFINKHLAAMLAAEELGGPVVGDPLDVSDDILMKGFNQRGKARKSRGHMDGLPEKRQRTIGQIWGRREQEESNDDEELNTRNGRQAAAKEMRMLTEDLLNIAVEEGTLAYVTMQRDAAAARFLVRAKVAQFHPKDAQRLRLIDFGQEIDE